MDINIIKGDNNKIRRISSQRFMIFTNIFLHKIKFKKGIIITLTIWKLNKNWTQTNRIETTRNIRKMPPKNNNNNKSKGKNISKEDKRLESYINHPAN